MYPYQNYYDKLKEQKIAKNVEFFYCSYLDISTSNFS